MARIAGITIPNDKRIVIALYLCMAFGPMAKKILAQAGVDENIRSKDLTDDQVNNIRLRFGKNYRLEGDLRRDKLSNIKRLKEINSYRGIRHAKGTARLVVNERSPIHEPFVAMLERRWEVDDVPSHQDLIPMAEQTDNGKAALKKKIIRQVSQGCAYIQATFNNTIVTLTDLNGNALGWSSTGNCGFKWAQKIDPICGRALW